MLDERKMLVLRAIVDDYIQTAEPVGSRSIARRHKLGVSPATIRNEMADLEETGYLQQPHISAGRIPSDKGYRFYVDMLMEPHAVTLEEMERVSGEIINYYREMDRLVQEASKLLSALTQSISVVIAPPVESCLLKHLQLVPIDESNVLAVLVLHPGMVKNKVIATKRAYTSQELERMSNSLNMILKGITYRELGNTLIRQLDQEFGEIGRALIEVISKGLSAEKSEQVYFNGTLNILNQPEFKDVERAKSLLGILEEKDKVMTILNELSRRGGVRIAIGHENRRVEMHDCSLVTATYSIGGEVIGTIGVIGPTRMEYSRVVSSVDLMASSLSQILGDLIK